MSTTPLFEDDPSQAPLADIKVDQARRFRVLTPNRNQLELRPSDLESLLPEGHRARIVWGFIEGQNLSALYADIKAVEGGVGRPAIAPEIVYALWLFATMEGVGSARKLAQLAQEHDAYRWICGGVQVNYHTLSDFRSQRGEALDGLLSENIASLMAAGVIKLKSVAQDGMRVRANAGAASFRRQEKLTGLLEMAQVQVAALKEAVEDDPGADARRRQAAKERAAKEREARIKAALERLPELADIKKRQGKAAEDARASTTDAEATVMKMGDGGFRPAYNIEFGTDTASQIIVGVDVVTTGSDMAQMAPMVEQVVERCGTAPENWLVDGGFPAHDQIDAVASHTRVIAPVPKPKTPSKNKKSKTADSADKTNAPVTASVVATDAEASDPAASSAPVVDPHQRKPSDSQAVGDWRERMGDEDVKELYKERAAVAECVNAQARNRNLVLLPVRGLKKVKAVSYLFALAHNLMRMISLAPELLGIGTKPSGNCPIAA
jgi:transposase